MEQQIRFCKTADGARIAYATVGSGPPLVKAANWLNHLEYDWQSPIWRPMLDELAKDFELIRYDERGNGLSDWNVAELSLELFVRDLEAVVEAAGLERFPLLGISQGGAVAITYAVRHPERVTHLILHGAYPRGWAKRGKPEEIERRRIMLDLIKLGWGQDNPAFRQLWTTLYIPGGTPGQMNWFNEMQRVSASPENAVRLFRTLSELDVLDLLPRVSTPTLVLHSRGDAAVPYEAGRQLAAHIPGARFVTLESSNHLLLQEEPAWAVFIEEIRRFLGAERPVPATPRPARTPAAPPASAPALLTPGDSLAHYRILSALGAGGMGVVYRARDTRLERDVALKLLAEHGPSRESHERLLAEARAASALNHPNVATIYEVGESSGCSYLAMECIEGRALSASIPPEGLPAETVLRYGMQIAAALAHAHDRGILHRDLKSANVIITPEGQAKVLDFGLAGRVPQGELSEATRSLDELDSSAKIAGTLHYLAPEVLRGEAPDARSDLWSLGVTLYEMAAGKLPFQGRTGFELTSAILRESPAPLPTHLSPGIRGVIQRCLAKDPGARYRTAAQVHAALEALSSDAAIAPTTPAPEKARPWWRRKVLLWALPAVALLAMGVWKGPQILRLGVTKTTPPTAQLSMGITPSANAEANEYFEKALLFLKVQFDLQRGRQLLEQALELDPKFAGARALHGLTYFLELDSGQSNDAGLLYRAEEELRQALQDEPGLPTAKAFLAGVYLNMGRKELARAEAEEALQAQPSNMSATHWLAQIHRLNGDYETAERLARENLARDPLFMPAHLILNTMYREQDRWDEAIRENEKIQEQDPRSIYAIVHLALVYVHRNEMDEARLVLGRARPEDQRNYPLRLTRALLEARAGNFAQAKREMSPEVLQYAGATVFSTLVAAEFYALLGEREEALNWLERAVRSGDERAEWFQRDPLLAGIRNQARFKQILESIAFRRQQRAR